LKGDLILLGIKHNPAPARLPRNLPLETLKRRKAEEIAAARWKAEVGGMTVNGATIDTSRESQAMITGAVMQAQMDPTYTCRWKTAQGFVEFDAETVTAIAQGVRAHVQACFDREAELNTAIGAATTPEAIQAITW
jgi:hypothetical protein